MLKRDPMSIIRWQPFPADPLICSGLPWLDEFLPHLWRLPVDSSSLPAAVRAQARFPAGARLRVRSDTTELRFKVRHTAEVVPTGFDVYVDGQFWRTANVSVDTEVDVVCFTGANRTPKEISIYLPLRHELQIVEWGIDREAKCERPASFEVEKPLVLYGSSIAQGIGAARPGMSYSAILGRAMNIDPINLGLGGAGRAEEEVVARVLQIEACCFVLDLGRSYGTQLVDPYLTMLTAIREAHPETPIVCVTATFSSRELHQPEYLKLSNHTRSVVRDSVEMRVSLGDENLTLVEGDTFLSAQDTDGLSADGLHPNDFGYSLIAQCLQPVIENVLS